MLSVLIEMRDDDAAGLASTLACLVPGAVDGLVREVVVIDRGVGPNGLRVAEHAGCAVRPVGELSEALAEARGEWVLAIEAGSQLSPGWIEAIARHTAGNARAMRFRPVSGHGGPFAWLRAFVPSPALARGVLAPRGECERFHREGMSLGDLAGRMRTRPIDATIRPLERRRS